MRTISLFAALSVSCTVRPDDHETADLDEAQLGYPDEPGTSDSSTVANITPPMLQALADQEADLRWPDRPIAGTLTISADTTAYLYGERASVELLLGGLDASAPLSAVLVDAAGICLGALSPVPDGLHLGAKMTVDGDELFVDGSAFVLDRCTDEAPALVALERASALLRQEDREDWQTEEPPAPPACASTCASSEGYSYGGETAKSNGTETRSGSACGGTGTYGFLYQCVEYTERVAKRSDWAGNAYTGYWTNTGLSSSSSSQGPYYKGLLPLGSGTGYLAPQAGDVVVWSGGTYGHVAVLASVGSSTVDVYDQNRTCGDQKCTLTYGTSYTLGNGSGTGYCGGEGLSAYTVRGYLHRGWDFGGTYGLASSSTSGASTHNWWLNDATLSGSTTSSSVTDITDYITIDPGTSDPFMTSPSGLAIPAYSSSATHGYKYVSFYIKSNCTSKSAQLFWRRTSDTSFTSSLAVSATISGSGWQTLTFSPSSSTSWSGTIDQIRLDPAASCSSGSTDTISIQSAWFWR